MLTPEGHAYLEGAIFLLQHHYASIPVDENQLAEYLVDEAPEISQEARQVIAKALIKEAKNPEKLKIELITKGWIEERENLQLQKLSEK